MRTELPVVSFLCIGFLLVLSPVFVHSRNTAVISLAIWLLLSNIIHGVDSIVWAGNVAVHVPAWCDIATRILLAAQIALPGCALAFARNLRRCAIGQEIAQKAYTFMQDLTFCLIFPIIYVVLHVIVQPHRFDIAQDYGCVASIYTSSVSIILIWLPRLFVCIATFVYAFLAIRGRLDSGLVFFSHMQDSPRLTILAFARPLLTSLFIASASIATTAVSMYARIAAVGGLPTWAVDTWQGVHAHITEPFVVLPTDTLLSEAIAAEWWVAPVCAFVVVAMTALGMVCRASSGSGTSLGGGRGSRVLSRYFRSAILRQPSSSGHPLSDASGKGGFRGETLSSAPTSPSPTLVGDTFKSLSGSDIETWRPAAPARVKLAPLTIPETPQSGSTRSASVYSVPDDPFVQSTLTYVGSPTGREALGLPPLAPPVSGSSHRPKAPLPLDYDAALLLQTRESSPPPPSRARTPSVKVKAPRPISILTASWPAPPATIPSTPSTPSPRSRSNSPRVSSLHAPLSPPPQYKIQPPSPAPLSVAPASSRPPSVVSLTTSVASSTISMGAYAASFLDDGPDAHVMPFQDHLDLAAADADSVIGGAIVPASSPRLGVPKRMLSRDALRPIPRGVSRRRQGSDLAGGIYMTVVKETV